MRLVRGSRSTEDGRGGREMGEGQEKVASKTKKENQKKSKTK